MLLVAVVAQLKLFLENEAILGNSGHRRYSGVCAPANGLFPIIRLKDGESVADAIGPHIQQRPPLVPLGLFSAV